MASTSMWSLSLIDGIGRYSLTIFYNSSKYANWKNSRQQRTTNVFFHLFFFISERIPFSVSCLGLGLVNCHRQLVTNRLLDYSFEADCLPADSVWLPWLDSTAVHVTGWGSLPYSTWPTFEGTSMCALLLSLPYKSQDVNVSWTWNRINWVEAQTTRLS